MSILTLAHGRAYSGGKALPAAVHQDGGQPYLTALDAGQLQDAYTVRVEHGDDCVNDGSQRGVTAAEVGVLGVLDGAAHLGLSLDEGGEKVGTGVCDAIEVHDVSFMSSGLWVSRVLSADSRFG